LRGDPKSVLRDYIMSKLSWSLLFGFLFSVTSSFGADIQKEVKEIFDNAIGIELFEFVEKESDEEISNRKKKKKKQSNLYEFYYVIPSTISKEQDKQLGRKRPSFRTSLVAQF
jgi:hypothetical protein